MDYPTFGEERQVSFTRVPLETGISVVHSHTQNSDAFVLTFGEAREYVYTAPYTSIILNTACISRFLRILVERFGENAFRYAMEDHATKEVRDMILAVPGHSVINTTSN